MKKDLVSRFSVSIAIICLAAAGCSGVKVVNPKEQNKNAGTLALDLSDGKPKLVGTYTCNLESTGNQYSAIGKTEDEARKEVVARCRNNAILTFCKPEKASCVKN
jgi:hypothetical protein